MLPSFRRSRIGRHPGSLMTPSSPRRKTYAQELLRIASTVLLGLLAFSIIFLLLRLVVVPFFAYLSPQLDIFFYRIGVYGITPEQSYRSFNLTSEITRSPFWNSDACDRESREGGLVLIDVHGTRVTHKGPRIVDLQGNLIWTDDSFGFQTMNLQLQEWKGEQYLTFWAGDHDLGDYYMLDSGFNHVKTVRPVGQGLWGDPHEFIITPQGTALIMIYNCTHDIDLSSTYMADLTPSILDAIIQEIDLDTDKLLWQWRASDHFDEGEYLKYTYDAAPAHAQTARPDCLYGEDKILPGDYFHMNSISKDSDGNYLVSIRKTHQIITISKDTGKILWGIGGRANDFTDLGEGSPSDFKWQHDARWIDEDAGIMTLFDNGIAENYYNGNAFSRGRILQLDVANRTVRELHSYSSLDHIRSTSQGSFQHLPGTAGSQNRPNAGITASPRDQVFTGYGSAAAFSLHDARSEELLCETHYAPSLFFYWEQTKTYRAVRAPKKFNFRPEKWDPNAVVENGRVYVSWNGGIEVRSWLLRGRDDLDNWQDIFRVERDGFETSFDLPVDSEACSAYAVAALDADGNILRYSNIFEPQTGIPMWQVLLTASATVVVVTMVYACVRDRRTRTRPLPRTFAGVFGSAGVAGRTQGYRKLEHASDEELEDLRERIPG